MTRGRACRIHSSPLGRDDTVHPEDALGMFLLQPLEPALERFCLSRIAAAGELDTLEQGSGGQCLQPLGALRHEARADHGASFIRALQVIQLPDDRSQRRIRAIAGSECANKPSIGTDDGVRHDSVGGQSI
jgi:hypothetical protein